jgi:hypothetical protein
MCDPAIHIHTHTHTHAHTHKHTHTNTHTHTHTGVVTKAYVQSRSSGEHGRTNYYYVSGYSDVTVVLQWYHSCVVVLQCCYSGVTIVLQQQWRAWENPLSLCELIHTHKHKHTHTHTNTHTCALQVTAEKG